MEVHLLHTAVHDEPWARWLDPNDFMRMGTERRGNAVISLYKHRDTRHYLNIDELGRTYGYREPTSEADEGDRGSYGRISHAAAIDAVGLWELPWMKPELDGERRGFRWEDRARHPVVRAALKRMTPQQRRWAIR